MKNKKREDIKLFLKVVGVLILIIVFGATTISPKVGTTTFNEALISYLVLVALTLIFGVLMSYQENKRKKQ